MKQREIDQANFVKAKEDLLKEFNREGQNFSKILPNARRVGYKQWLSGIQPLSFVILMIKINFL